MINKWVFGSIATYVNFGLHTSFKNGTRSKRKLTIPKSDNLGQVSLSPCRVSSPAHYEYGAAADHATGTVGIQAVSKPTPILKIAFLTKLNENCNGTDAPVHAM